MKTITLAVHLSDEEYEKLKAITARYNQWLREGDLAQAGEQELTPEKYLAARVGGWIKEEFNEK